MTLVRDNKYIPSEDKDFFILLRIGLWQKVEEELSSNPDWEYIYKLATEQTVQGIITDGIGLYRKQYPDLNITQEQNERFLNITAQIIKRNYAVNQLQARICQLFDNPSRINELFPNTENETAISESALSLLGKAGIEAPIHYVILKGQAVAQCYPKPMLRCSGDIDVLVPYELEDYSRARELMLAISDGHDRYQEDIKHQGFFFGDLEVEIHGEACSRLYPKMDKVIEKEKLDMFIKKDFVQLQNSISVFQAPRLEYHLLFLVCHIFRHIMLEGVGLRQFCDISEFLSAKKGALDFEYLHNLIQKSDILRQWNIVCNFITQYINPDYQDPYIQSSSSNSYNSICLCRNVWRDCKNTGNFGHNGKKELELLYGNTFRRGISHMNTANKLFCQRWKYSPSVAVTKISEFYYGLFIELMKKMRLKCTNML